MEKVSMSTKEIQVAICKMEVLKGSLACENIGFFNGEADCLSLNKNGFAHEFEVKVSRSDFKADLKKSKWVYFENRVERAIPNYFSYACPTGLIQISEIPAYAGLIYLEGGEIEIQKSPKLLHKCTDRKDKLIVKISRMLSERVYLGSCRLTYNNKKHMEWVAAEYPDLLN